MSEFLFVLHLEQEFQTYLSYYLFLFPVYCAAGYEVLSAVSHTCTACEQGTFKTNEGSAKLSNCQPCPSANTTNDVASESEADCNIREYMNFCMLSLF